MLNIPNIKFIVWESFEGPGIPRGLQRRLLSQSPSMGAVAQITYVPAGWSHPAGYHDEDTEIFVLDGDLTLSDKAGEEKLTKYSYSYMPAGEMHGMKSRQGAVLLEWWKGKPNFVASSRDKKGARDYARVRDWNRYQQPWYINEPFPAYRLGGNFPG
jgi:quercetin dioxygenase-like cupin family protein